jgi:WD40 repeat protein
MLLKANKMLSSSDDGTMRIWDLNTGQCNQILDNDIGKILMTPIVFSSHIVVCGANKKLMVWGEIQGQYKVE